MSYDLGTPPAGFERHTRTSPLTAPWEPIYSRRSDTTVSLGLHCARCIAIAVDLLMAG